MKPDTTETQETVPSERNTPDAATLKRPLRIWPVLLLLAGMALTRFIPQMIEDGPVWIWMMAAFGPILCGGLVLVWWVAGSRASWKEKGAGFFGVLILLGVTTLLIDQSMMGPGMMVITIPMGIAAFAIGTIVCWRVLSFRRTVVALVLAMVGFGYSTLVRSEGLWGNFSVGLHWRWEPTSEELLSRDVRDRQAPAIEQSALTTALSDPEWPGFRGPKRDSKQTGTTIATDWDADPPELLWKIVVGPGWSSFTVAGNLLFTQEQRGQAETVVCYDAESGLEVWTRPFESRFDDPLGGPGPRATPTLAGDGLFALGGTGILAKLDPATGDVLWEQELRDVAKREPPMWGFSSSPLVIDSSVIVHAGGEGELGVLAFDSQSGDLQWSAPAGDHSYSSPQLAEINDREFVLCLSNTGLDLLNPADGAVELHYEWPIEAHRSLQPQVFDSDTVVIPSDLSEGTRRIRIVDREGELSTEDVWKSRKFNPDFNDIVIHNGHAYGFDNQIFACLDLASGDLNWKGGRYGKGQVLLLESAGLLLVMGEQGQVVLLEANPERHVELATFQALDGKTWNHPVVVGDRLYVRNSQEAAAWRLPTPSDAVASASNEEK